MARYVIALVLVLALLSGASPWPSMALPLDLAAAPVLDSSGWPGPIAAVVGGLLALVLAGGVLLVLLGGLLMLVLSAPVLLVLALLALVFAPALIPLLLLLMVVGAVLKGLTIFASC